MSSSWLQFSIYFLFPFLNKPSIPSDSVLFPVLTLKILLEGKDLKIFVCSLSSNSFRWLLAISLWSMGTLTTMLRYHLP